MMIDVKLLDRVVAPKQNLHMQPALSLAVCSKIRATLGVRDVELSISKVETEK